MLLALIFANVRVPDCKIQKRLIINSSYMVVFDKVKQIVKYADFILCTYHIN